MLLLSLFFDYNPIGDHRVVLRYNFELNEVWPLLELEMRLIKKVFPMILLLSLALTLGGCARGGNLKEAVYEAVRAANNVHQPPPIGENKQNEWSYREYEQKRNEVMSGDESESGGEKQRPPEWLIDPSR